MVKSCLWKVKSIMLDNIDKNFVDTQNSGMMGYWQDTKRIGLLLQDDRVYNRSGVNMTGTHAEAPYEDDILEYDMALSSLTAKLEDSSQRHYAREVPLRSADYGSFEGWVAVNVNPTLPPEMTTFTVLPNIRYYEFIPLTEITETTEIKLEIAFTNNFERDMIEGDLKA
ncbi:hypothetical protein CTI12_AA232820 [Artemisia annua]|uniref:Uncharacterized protein n=1 Tax=Artemisia annua TaxID=35608 RepID=A0A2U1NSY6_ARTAN|nr:hypothetical protein CTI12_AA232820 [Artemisia annua]